MPLFDLHVHTVRGSSDSNLTPTELIDSARAIGLDERTGFLEVGDPAEFVFFELDDAGDLRVL